MNVHSLSARSVTKKYTQGTSDIWVLQGITFDFARGKSYGLTGVSGSGKSTLLHLLAGLDEPTSGAIYYDNADINHFSARQKKVFLNQSIGLVFQYPYLIKELSTIENVMLKGLIAGQAEHACSLQAKELLEMVGLASKIDSYPGQLSGGQQQRVALARALMNRPVFLLADEPTGNLDVHTGISVLEVILRMQKEWGMGLIISSHDRYVTERLENVYALKDGLLVQVV